MNRDSIFKRGKLVVLAFVLFPVLTFGETFRIATYNLDNYLDQPTESRHFVKSKEAKAKIRESILSIKPDVIAIEEIGSLSALNELRASLKADGLEYTFWEYVSGWDTNIHLAVMSRFPIIERRSHTNDTFLSSGRRFHVSRGFSEVDIQVNSNYVFTLLGAHLKSKRPVPEEDQAELRLKEAGVLRARVDSILKANPDANLVVLGDLNDTKDSPSTKLLVGRGKTKLVDTRPAERNGDSQENPINDRDPMNVTWTYYYGVEDSYSRIDYILLSSAMARNWMKEETYTPTIPNWGMGSDHRPIVATFEIPDR